MEMFREDNVPVSQEGEEDVAVMSSPTVNPFSGKGDGEVTVDSDCWRRPCHEEGCVALWGRVDYFVEMFGEEGSEEGRMSG
jgi:hypothetical protein